MHRKLQQAEVTRRSMLAMGLSSFAPSAPPPLRLAAFQCDATPDPGEPNIWVQPVTSVLDPLFVKGVVLEHAGRRHVLAAIDWCGVGGETDLLLRSALARGAGAGPARVALQSVHQHAAPYIDGDGYRLLAQTWPRALRMSDAFLRKLASRMQQAVHQAAARLQVFDQIGVGQARVEQVASARRILKDGKILTRYSSTARAPELAAEPEGAVDQLLRTITFARAGRPLARLHYYASHPQTFCCDGRVSADFVGAARSLMEAGDGVPQIYFTGCGGDVTVGKYNRGADEERAALAARLLAGMKASAAATRYQDVRSLEWRYRDLVLTPRVPDNTPQESGQLAYRAAITAAFAARRRPLPASALHIGSAVIIHLPGEPLIEFQNFAQSLSQGRFTAVAGYGDISPGYLCPDEALRQGGYEPSASNVQAGSEARVKEVIRQLMGARAQ